MSAATIDYVRLMDATWRLMNTGHDAQQRLLDTLPDAERRLIAPAIGTRLDLELARRRKSLGKVLHKTFPVTYFAFVAMEGIAGVMRFLGSDVFHDRDAERGSIYPPAASTTLAFRRFLDGEGWRDRQQAIVRAAYDFEVAYLFRPATPPPPRTLAGHTVRLAANAWVAEAPYDVPSLADALRERGREEPWHDVMYAAAYVPRPFAVISKQTSAATLRRLRLTDAAVTGLRWIWDPAAENPPSTFVDSVLWRRAVRDELVEIEG
jgi:hypothetical protein